LAATPSVSNTRARRTSPAEQGVAATPLFSPTGFPEEPITAGADFGPGDGPAEQEGFQEQLGKDFEMIKQYLPDLEAALDFDDTPSTFRFLVSYLRNV
jgi:hypothetical protein